MTAAILLRQETNLVGQIKNFNVLPTSTVIYAEFFDLKTGVPRAPRTTTKYFVLNKDNQKFEGVLASSVTTDSDNLTTITIATNGRDMPQFGTGLGGAVGRSHSIGDSIGCVYTHQQLEEVLEVMSGTNSTGGNSFRIGTDTDVDIKVVAANGDINEPFIEYDSTLSKWIISNDGVNSYDPQAGGSGVTAGNGISILAGVVSARIKTGGGLAFDGGELVAAGFQAVTTHARFNPAFVTSGAGVLNAPATWALVTNGSFRVTIDGTARNVTGISFAGVASQADVAARIQTAIRAVTGSTETCVWNAGTSRFVISSAKTDGTGTITVLTTSTVSVGTDISGLGGVNFLDMDAGNGTVTNTVLNPALDAGSIVALGSNGNINNELLNNVSVSTGAPDASKLVVTNASGKVDDSLLPSAPTVQVLTGLSTRLGSGTSRFDLTKSGSTMRYTWDGSGTNPNITSLTFPVGSIVDYYATGGNVANNIISPVTNSGTNFFEITNAGGVAENDIILGSGYLEVSTLQYTKPAGLKYAIVEVQGAGGNGTLSNRPGQSGAYARKLFAASAIGATEYYKVGRGGTTVAQNGSSSYFDGVSCIGGKSGDVTTIPAVATGGDININGQLGTVPETGAPDFYPSGADSFLGLGGFSVNSAATAGNATGYGAGGGTGPGTATAGNGSQGVIIVTEYFI